MADHPHSRARSKPTLVHHWNRIKYQGNLVAGAHMLQRGHVGFGSSVRKGKFDREFWEVVGFQNETEQVPYLRLIHGKKPADAINKMFEKPGLWSFDCAEFVQAVELFAILKTVGDEGVFNAHHENLLFRQHGSTGLGKPHGIKHSWEFDEGGALLNAEGKTVDRDFLNRRIKESPNGSEVTFKNSDPIAKDKVWGSENTIKLGPDQFIAHGVGEGIVTRRQIEDAMARGVGQIPDTFYRITNIRIHAIIEFNLH